jgi:lysophospholipase L1-like esterase
MLKNLLLISLLSLSLVKNEPLKIYLIGDSTMARKDPRTYPETGWGMPFIHFFDSTVVVDNRAQNGRSTRTFIEENRWTPVVDALKPGDFVFIQFGHNDEIATKKSATTPEQFKSYLKKYVSDSRLKKARPVLLTSVARRKFDINGKIVGTHDLYAQLVREVAKETNTPLIDMDVKSQALLQELGPERSALLFNHLKPGDHPNYPGGKTDDTHFNELGARLMAQLVLAEIKAMNLDLKSRVVKSK